MKVKLIIACAVCLLVNLSANANVYVVTDNGDNGPGTLRQAITDANSNAGIDTINFNLADSSVTGRTIMLNTVLPSLTEAVSIDGTSQPYGTKFGISFAKIEVTASASLAQCFNIVADSCNIYGVFVTGFQTGILISMPFVKIGAINKGNVIFNCTFACIVVEGTHHVNFIANLIGIDTSENVAAGSAGDGIQVNNSYAIAIGGHSSAASNEISGNNFGVKFDNAVSCDMNGNFIGTSSDGLIAIPNLDGIRGSGLNSTDIQIGGDSLYERNIISGNTHAGIYGNFSLSVIQGNYIGTDATGQGALGNGDAGIYLTDGSDNNLIGGDQQSLGNIIAYNGQQAMVLQGITCDFNTIRSNSTFCNSQGGFTFNGGNGNIYSPFLSIANANGVTGVTYPNSTLDIFQDDSCNHCEGKTLISTISTASNGVFIYNGLLSGMITATVSDSVGNTSQYSSCVSADDTTCMIAQFNTSATSICENSLLSFVDQTITAPGTDLSSWQWNFGDANTSVSEFPTHAYAIPGIFTITLIVTNSLGCMDTISKTVAVTSAPAADFTSPITSCTGIPVNFTDQSLGGNGAVVTGWQWDFGDGNTSSLQNASSTFDTSGTYTITLTVTNSNQCTDQIQSMINVVDPAIPAFSFTVTNLQATFTNTSIVNGPVSFSWNFGDGSASNVSDPVHDFASGGLYSVCLTVYDSVCMNSDTVCQTVDLPVGISNPTGNTIIIGPNPVKDALIISGLFSSQVNSISIRDLLGRKMLEEKIPQQSSSLILNLKILPEGFYIIEMKSNDSVISRKISVIH
jgi:PKD repeat protein